MYRRRWQRSSCYELDGDLKLRRTNDPASVAWAKTNLAIPRDFLTADNASVDLRGKSASLAAAQGRRLV